ncbi:MAG: glycerol-3-phosphate 1-O-acyltransferase PlsY [Lachnospiraceae bacterium]|jgi:glycerol-3-phosphate acyltransferase PlsY|nr:glycerol-3-phosphate 1-O-acyltransferase PlsY [Lachnospiraceae bacterium]
MSVVEILLCLAVGYFCGCISSGYFVGKFYHTDIRTLGSGNAGTTNVLRNFGVLPAIITFVGDLAKAVVPILLIRFCFTTQTDAYLLCLYCGLGVVLGHNYPFYLGFKGGKGIAVTSAVVMSAAHPIMIPVGLAIFIAAVVLTRYVSVGSLFVAWYIPANTLIFHYNDRQFIHMMVISLLFTVFAYFQHRQNIVRIIHGNENKLWQK